MAQASGQRQDSGFSRWLRTGLLPIARNPDGAELKFNSWHDSKDGRFTFAGAGQHHGRWGGGSSGGGENGTADGSEDSSAGLFRPRPRNTISQIKADDPGRAAPSGRRVAPNARGRTTGGGGSFTGGGGGSFGRAGASGPGWKTPVLSRPRATLHGFTTVVGPARRAAHRNVPSARSASGPDKSFRRVARNGYTYEVDARTRTRRVSGVLTMADKPVRSRTSQRRAGGADRRTSDDGGHYVAARFNGPAEAFNHFAQDANFNRGSYRLLEAEWARDKRAGRAVVVKIVPGFDGASLRPATIDVWWTVDGSQKSTKFSNQRAEKHRGGK